VKQETKGIRTVNRTFLVSLTDDLGQNSSEQLLSCGNDFI
jgi:hypothetical protein